MTDFETSQRAMAGTRLAQLRQRGIDIIEDGSQVRNLLTRLDAIVTANADGSFVLPDDKDHLAARRAQYKAALQSLTDSI